MNNLLEKKLTLFHESYHRKLITEINKIDSLFNALKLQWEAEMLTDMKNTIQHFIDLVRIYKHYAIAEVLEQLTMIFSTLHETKTPSKEHCYQIQLLISKLNSAITLSPLDIPTDTVKNSSPQKYIYLFEQNNAWGQKFNLRLTQLGYQVNYCEDIELLLYYLLQNPCGTFIINFDLLTAELQDVLKNNRSKNYFVFFIANKTDFNLRMQAAILGSSAYFLKPFKTEEIVNKIENIFVGEFTVSRVLIIHEDKNMANEYLNLFQENHLHAEYILNYSEIDSALKNFKPHLIFIKSKMLGYSNNKFRAAIQQKDELKNIPIIFDTYVKDTNKLLLLIKNEIQAYKLYQLERVYDPISGVLSYAESRHKLDAAINSSGRFKQQLIVIAVNFITLNEINNLYGYSKGEQLIKTFCYTVQKRIRVTDFLGRYNEQIFLMVLSNTTEEYASSLLANWANDLQREVETHNNPIFQAGISVYPVYKTTIGLIAAALQALNENKLIST